MNEPKTFSGLYTKLLDAETKSKNTLVKAVLYQNQKFDIEFKDNEPSEEVFEFIDKIFYKVDKAFQKGFKSIIDYFATTTIMLDDIIEYKTKTPSIKQLYSLWKDFRSISKEKPFYKISKRKVPVMMGLDIKLNEVVNILKSLEPEANNAEQTLKKFNKMLQTILDNSENEFMKNLDKNLLNTLTKAEEKINKKLKSVTNDNVLTDRKPLKEVVDNWDDMNNDISDTLKLGVTYSMQRLEDIYSIQQENIELLDALYKTFSGKTDAVDKEALKVFIKYVDAGAKYITSLGFLYYLYYQLADMLVAIIKVIQVTKDDPNIADNVAYAIKAGYNTILNAVKSLLG